MQIAYLVSGGMPVVVILPMGQHSLLNLLIPALCSHLEAKTHLSVLQQTTIKAFIFSFPHLGEFSEPKFTDDLTHKCCCLTAKDISWNMLTHMFCSQMTGLGILFQKTIRKIKQKTHLPCTHLLRDYDIVGILIWRSVAHVFQLGVLQRIRKKTPELLTYDHKRDLRSIPDGQIPHMSFSRSMLSLLPVWQKEHTSWFMTQALRTKVENLFHTNSEAALHASSQVY